MGKVFTFLSVVQGNGSQFLATEIAYHLKNRLLKVDPSFKEILNKDKRSPVLLIDFNLSNPYLCRNLAKDLDRGLDTLMPSLTNSNLTDLVFQRNIELLDIDVDLLKGFQMPNQYNAITDEQIINIISKAKELYEFVVIVAELKINNLATPHSLFMSDEVFLIMRQNSINAYKTPEALTIVEQFAIEKPINIIFNYQDSLVYPEINALFLNTPLNIQIVADYPFEATAMDFQLIENKGGLFNKNQIYSISENLAISILKRYEEKKL